MEPQIRSINAVEASGGEKKPELWSPSDFELMFNNLMILQQDDEEVAESGEQVHDSH